MGLIDTEKLSSRKPVWYRMKLELFKSFLLTSMTPEIDPEVVAILAELNEAQAIAPAAAGVHDNCCMVCLQCGGKDHVDVRNIPCLQVPRPVETGANYGSSKKRGPNSKLWSSVINMSNFEMNKELISQLVKDHNSKNCDLTTEEKLEDALKGGIYIYVCSDI